VVNVGENNIKLKTVRLKRMNSWDLDQVCRFTLGVNISLLNIEYSKILIQYLQLE
jgi:molybdenum cofactor biosynthesis enzyme MoaA